MKKYALIVAGGLGKRMNSKRPKQFIEIAGKPLLMHTFFAFQKYSSDINYILVLPEKHFFLWEKLVKKYQFKIKHQKVAGGEKRFFSVKNGLEKVDDDALVAIHDGVRPFVSPLLIKKLFENSKKHGNAVPAIALKDSVRIVDGSLSVALKRDKLKLVQTPQVFRANLIKEAYKQEYLSSFTDDACVFEAMNKTVHIIEGSQENIKITYASDIKIAEAMLSPV